MEPTRNFTEEQIKATRVAIDGLVQFMQHEQAHGSVDIINTDESLYALAAEQALVHLIDAKMWLGKMLEGRGTPFPPELADRAVIPTGNNLGGAIGTESGALKEFVNRE